MELCIVNYSLDTTTGSHIALERLATSLQGMDDSLEVTILNVDKADLKTNTLRTDRHRYDYVLVNEPTYELTNPKVARQYLALITPLLLSSRACGLWIQGEYSSATKADAFSEFYTFLGGLISEVYTITEGLKDNIRRNIWSDSYRPSIHILPGCGNFSTTSRRDRSSQSISIGFVNRITSMKKPNNFLRLMSSIQRTHSIIDFEMHGRFEGGIQQLKTLEITEECGYVWEDIWKGAFQVTETTKGSYTSPISNFDFAWCGSMLGKGNQIKFAPRIELTTIEAWQNGVIPILFNEVTPEWVPKGSYIGINWLDINHISKDMDKVAKYVISQIKAFYCINSRGIEEICTNALENVLKGWKVNERYNYFLRDIKGDE